jgi:hypothetical protein
MIPVGLHETLLVCQPNCLLKQFATEVMLRVKVKPTGLKVPQFPEAEALRIERKPPNTEDQRPYFASHQLNLQV